MILFNCDACGHQLYFESTRCVRCHSELGYAPSIRAVTVLDRKGDAPEFTVQSSDASGSFRRCQNFGPGRCNWLLPPESGTEFCVACARSWLVPDLSVAENRARWSALEAAKRRLLFTLEGLGLAPLLDATEQAPALSFRFLLATPDAPVTTGHANGVVTIDIAEGDAAHRAAQRKELGERYRTPLGHLRHETGHYFFLRLIDDDDSRHAFRDHFGDETVDYQAALDRHYQSGPPGDWRQSFVSAYASMHPAEDWAETFAHYLHMVDTLETAHSFGIAVARPSTQDTSGPPAKIHARAVDFDNFESLLEAWNAVSLALNSLNRSMGHPDAYPFALSPPATAKLRFVHDTIARRRSE